MGGVTAGTCGHLEAALRHEGALRVDVHRLPAAAAQTLTDDTTQRHTPHKHTQLEMCECERRYKDVTPQEFERLTPIECTADSCQLPARNM